MQADASDPRLHLPLRPVVFEILLVLNEGERHGYGLMQDLKERSGGRWVLGPGTLYRTLNEMVRKRFIEPGGDRKAPDAGDERRRYYRLTPFGRKVAAAEAQRMASLVEIAQAGRLLG